ncbi:hypothetical protein AOLI_G00313410 [Acnodon oligacanthus]
MRGHILRIHRRAEQRFSREEICHSGTASACAVPGEAGCGQSAGKAALGGRVQLHRLVTERSAGVHN